MSTQRTYRSPLREEQAKQTRTLILENLIDLVSEEGAADLSIRDLARRAGVSQRTVYRHFPDRSALLDGLADHVGEISRWGPAAARSHRLPDLADTIPEMFAIYDRFEAETRAVVLLNLDPARVASITRRNQEMVRALVAQEYPHLTEDQQAESVAVLHLLASSRTWLRFRDQDGLSPGQAGRAARTAALAYLAYLDGPMGRGER